MSYFREIPIQAEDICGYLYITDDAARARQLQKEGEAVVVYSHEGNRCQDFTGFSYAVENPEELPADYYLKVWERLKGLPRKITETERCVVREMIPEDASAFFALYEQLPDRHFLSDLHESQESEMQYIRDYRDHMYAFYEFGIWTILEKSSRQVIGKAGFSMREGFEEPELGYMLGVDWQGKGIASEVCRALISYAFEELDFPGILLFVEPDNRSSLHLCEALHFTYVGKIHLEGKNCLEYALTKGENNAFYESTKNA